jgi:ribosomal protein S27AE
MHKNKVNLREVLRHLNALCPECHYSIPPSEIVRLDFERIRCPKCGAVFDSSKKKAGR